MDALDRILPLASLLWPVLDCDVSISRDPATGDATYRARVFDVDHPDGLAAKPLAEGTGVAPSDAATALASHLATLARPRLDVLLRAAGVSPSQRADLADDVARLERAVADLTRECGRLRAQLEAAHRGRTMTHPLAALAATVRRELDALLCDAAPATPEARHTASRLLSRAADAVHSARLAAASRVTT